MGATGASPAEIEQVYRSRFRAFLLSVTALLQDGEAARDVVQEGFALALRRRASFRGEGDLEAWLWRIVLNVARDRLRQRQRESVPHRVELRGEVPEGAGAMRVSLLALPERQRLAVFLRYYADLSYAQIADALGVKAGTVAASLNAAHAALRRELEEALG